MAVFTDWNALLTVPPNVEISAIQTAAISATIMPYSTIVAPSSLRRSVSNLRIFWSFLLKVSLVCTVAGIDPLERSRSRAGGVLKYSDKSAQDINQK